MILSSTVRTARLLPAPTFAGCGGEAAVHPFPARAGAGGAAPRAGRILSPGEGRTVPCAIPAGRAPLGVGRDRVVARWRAARGADRAGTWSPDRGGRGSRREAGGEAP